MLPSPFSIACLVNQEAMGLRVDAFVISVTGVACFVLHVVMHSVHAEDHLARWTCRLYQRSSRHLLGLYEIRYFPQESQLLALGFDIQCPPNLAHADMAVSPVSPRFCMQPAQKDLVVRCSLYLSATYIEVRVAASYVYSERVDEI